MTIDVWLAGNTLSYVEGGGQLWIHLNWALSLTDAGCRVTWVELDDPEADRDAIAAATAQLVDRLRAFGLADRFHVVGSRPGDHVISPAEARERLSEADLLLSLCYWFPEDLVRAAPCSALVDIDPGLLQIWIEQGDMVVAPHDHYFTIGETVGTPDARFPDCGITWSYTPPPVHLPSWPEQRSPGKRYTTVTHWWEDGWVYFDGEEYQNDKRTSFLEFLDVPRLSAVPLELATNLTDGDDDERKALLERGWHLRDSTEVSRRPEKYRRYIQQSRGEFSCAKPSCMRLQNAWVSDRTICYLASGRPAVVQDTGPSAVLPSGAGIFRFRTPTEAARALRAVEEDHEHHAREARALAVERFDGASIARSVLERCS